MAHIFCYIQIGTLTLHDGMAVCVSSQYKCQIYIYICRKHTHFFLSLLIFCLFFSIYSAALFDLSIIGCLLCKVNYFDWILHIWLLFWFEKKNIAWHNIVIWFWNERGLWCCPRKSSKNFSWTERVFVVAVVVVVVTDDDVTETWFNLNWNWHL